MDARKADKDEHGSTGIQFAYVDHNGNLSDSPPDPDLKIVYELEDIQISVTKKEDLPEENLILYTHRIKKSFYIYIEGFFLCFFYKLRRSSMLKNKIETNNKFLTVIILKFIFVK